jgi:HEAT repeat protein
MALAVQILGEIRDRASVDQLIYLSAYRNEAKQPYPAEIRLAVAEALAKLGRPEGVFIAHEYASSEIGVVRAQAAHVYGHAGSLEHLGALERMMGDSEGMVGISAAAGVLRVLGREETRASAR